MPLVKRMFYGIFVLLDQLKGRRRVSTVTPTDDAPFTLTGLAVAGYEITIRCYRRQFRSEWPRWYVPGAMHTSYEVSATVSADAPARLREACKLTATFPSFVVFSSLYSEKRQMKLAIDAYLDLLREVLEDTAETPALV